MSMSQPQTSGKVSYIRGSALTLLTLTILCLLYALGSMVWWKLSANRGLDNLQSIHAAIRQNSPLLSATPENALEELISMNAISAMEVRPSGSVLTYEVVSLESPVGDSTPVAAARLSKPLINIERYGFCHGGLIVWSDGHAGLYCTPEFERVLAKQVESAD